MAKKSDDEDSTLAIIMNCSSFDVTEVKVDGTDHYGNPVSHYSGKLRGKNGNDVSSYSFSPGYGTVTQASLDMGSGYDQPTKNGDAPTIGIENAIYWATDHEGLNTFIIIMDTKESV